MDVIGMTNLQEAKLAREAEICYATLALVTDYDCWHPGHDAVSLDTVVEYLNKNVSQCPDYYESCGRAVNPSLANLQVRHGAEERDIYRAGSLAGDDNTKTGCNTSESTRHPSVDRIFCGGGEVSYEKESIRSKRSFVCVCRCRSRCSSDRAG